MQVPRKYAGLNAEEAEATADKDTNSQYQPQQQHSQTHCYKKFVKIHTASTFKKQLTPSSQRNFIK